MPRDTLFVRGLPYRLSASDQRELLQRLGARRVHICDTNSPLKHAAFAQFADTASAEKVLHILHQRTLLGRPLRVEYAKDTPVFDRLPNPVYGLEKVKHELKKKPNDDVKDSKQSNINAISEKINSMCTNWNVNYPPNPKLKYLYPPPSISILTNIANALATVPKFYVQVLHLMNRFNLPAPFGPVTQTPPLFENKPLTESIPLADREIIEEEEMAISSSEESELQSSDDSGRDKVALVRPPKRRNTQKTQRTLAKKIRLLTNPNVAPVKPSALASVSIDEAFEHPVTNIPRKIEIKQVNVNAPKTESLNLTNEVNLMLRGIHQDPSPIPAPPNVSPDQDAILQVSSKTEPQRKVGNAAESVISASEAPVDLLSVLASQEEQSTTTQQPCDSGFGKMEPRARDNESEEEGEAEEEWGAGQFISSRSLRRGRISSREMNEVSVFRGYEVGEPSSRLYIKNIAKPVTDKDLHYVYGRYVDWDNDLQKAMFDIRLMKEGRMKGQAFVTLASAEKAEQALRDTNGFELHGKPLVVHFARSAKPKPDAKNEAKGDKTSRAGSKKD